MGIAIDESVAMNGEMVEGKRDAGALNHAGNGINIKFLNQISFRFAWLTRNLLQYGT